MKLSKRVASLSLILLISGSSGCTTKVDAYVPLDCPGIPSHNVIFTDSEKASITDSVALKVSTIINTYKERIKTQCKLINNHNEIHGNGYGK